MTQIPNSSRRCSPASSSKSDACNSPDRCLLALATMIIESQRLLGIPASSGRTHLRMCVHLSDIIECTYLLALFLLSGCHSSSLQLFPAQYLQLYRISELNAL